MLTLIGAFGCCGSHAQPVMVLQSAVSKVPLGRAKI